MRTVQDITFGVAGQVLYFDAPEGRPSSVSTPTVFKWNGGDEDTNAIELATTGAATVETNPNTTTDAAAGASQDDPQLVPLTATTGCADDRTFLLIGANGLTEWVELDQVAAGVSVTARHPLHNDYASGALFVSTRISIVVDTTWCSDKTNIDPSAGPNPMYRVRWVYVVAGATKVVDAYFNLVRYAGRHGVTPQDVEVFSAGWLDRLPKDHRADQGRDLIDEAYRAVKLDLHQVDFDDSAMAESEIADELVRYKTIELTEFARFLSSPGTDESRHKLAEGKYNTRLTALVSLVARTPKRDLVTGAAALVPSTPLTRR